MFAWKSKICFAEAEPSDKMPDDFEVGQKLSLSDESHFLLVFSAAFSFFATIFTFYAYFCVRGENASLEIRHVGQSYTLVGHITLISTGVG